jgi:hypothetical protein
MRPRKNPRQGGGAPRFQSWHRNWYPTRGSARHTMVPAFQSDTLRPAEIEQRILRNIRSDVGVRISRPVPSTTRPPIHPRSYANSAAYAPLSILFFATTGPSWRVIAPKAGEEMISKLDEAVARAVKKVPGNRGAAKVLLMDALQRNLALEDESLLTSITVIVDQVVDEGIHLDNLEALIAEVVRRARRAHLRLVN